MFRYTSSYSQKDKQDVLSAKERTPNDIKWQNRKLGPSFIDQNFFSSETEFANCMKNKFAPDWMELIHHNREHLWSFITLIFCRSPVKTIRFEQWNHSTIGHYMVTAIFALSMWESSAASSLQLRHQISYVVQNVVRVPNFT